MPKAKFVNIKLDGNEVRDRDEEGNLVQIGNLIEIDNIHYAHIGKNHYRLYRDARIKNGKIIPGTIQGWYLVLEKENDSEQH